jgi:hypothetical protein
MKTVIKAYLKRAYQNQAVLDFFVPYFEKHTTVIHNLVKKKDELNIGLAITEAEEQAFFDGLRQAWQTFFEQNEEIFQVEKTSEVAHLFMPPPHGHLHVIDTSEEYVEGNEALLDATLTNLKVLEFMEVQPEREEHLMTLLLTFMYALEGYSTKVIQQHIELFLNKIKFDPATQQQLDEQVEVIYQESEQFIAQHLQNVYQELEQFYPAEAYPSIASQWKQSYYTVFQNLSNVMPSDKIQVFKQLKNQLDIIDAEAYLVLNLLKKHFESR